MGHATREYFREVFGETLEILCREAMDHLVTGTIANFCHLGDAWDPGGDIDLLITKDDAERCLEIFPGHGYAVHVHDPSWIFKVAKPNVTVDLIFVSGERIELDEGMVRHSVERGFEGLAVRLPSVEDMTMLSVAIDSELRQGYWYDALRYLKLVQDWGYLLERAEAVAPTKTLGALLYALDAGIDIPGEVLDQLGRSILPTA
ncbi:MAG: hypothetical protein ACRD02_07955 [Acidimicrobiia bacterium]